MAQIAQLASTYATGATWVRARVWSARGTSGTTMHGATLGLAKIKNIKITKAARGVTLGLAPLPPFKTNNESGSDSIP